MNDNLTDWIVRAYGKKYADEYDPELMTRKDYFDTKLRGLISEEKGVRLIGCVGSGKTFLTIRYVELLTENYGFPFYTLVTKVHEYDLFDHILNKRGPIEFKRYVIIDDYCSVRIPEWLHPQYENIYEKLHADNHILIITTNFDDTRASALYERTHSRVMEITQGIKLPTVDRRKK